MAYVAAAARIEGRHQRDGLGRIIRRLRRGAHAERKGHERSDDEGQLFHKTS